MKKLSKMNVTAAGVGILLVGVFFVYQIGGGRARLSALTEKIADFSWLSETKINTYKLLVDSVSQKMEYKNIKSNGDEDMKPIANLMKKHDDEWEVNQAMSVKPASNNAKTMFDKQYYENQSVMIARNNAFFIAGNGKTMTQTPGVSVALYGDEHYTTPTFDDDKSAGMNTFVPGINIKQSSKNVNLIAAAQTTSANGTAAVSSSTDLSGKKSVQKVGGNPAEPGMGGSGPVGSLPIGDGILILLILATSYAVFRRKSVVV